MQFCSIQCMIIPGERRINAETAPQVAAAGANVPVVGEAIFGAREGVAEAMRRIRESLQTVTEE